MKKIMVFMLAVMCFLTACGGSSKEPTTAEVTQNPGQASGSAASGESDVSYVKEKGKLIVGITDFEPMDYKDKSGQWVGFDADMAREFAKSLGVEAEFVEIEWDNKVMELNAKSLDCVWNGMTLTDEVTSSMECSKPYCNNAQVAIVKKEDADKYQTVESLKELSFAVEGGSAGEKVLSGLKYNFTPVKAQSDALMEVSAGTSDAAVIDSLMAAAMVGEGTSYENLTYTASFNSEEYGVGFRKGSDLAEKLNSFLAENYKNGRLTEIAKKYGVQAALVEQ